MNTDTKIDVLIVGAGPTGLALATDLLRWGLKIRLIDQAPKPSELSRAVVVLPRTIEAFRVRGMHQRLLDLGAPVHRFLSYYQDQLVFNIGYAGIHSNFNYLLNISQCDTEKVLQEELDRLGGEVEWNTELVSFEDRGDSVHARIILPDGSSEDLQVAYLMGADGAHSVVRHSLEMEFNGGAYNDVWLLADVDINWSLPHGNSYSFFGEDTLLAVFPMPKGRSRIYLLQPANYELNREPAFDDIITAVERVIPGKCTLSNPGWISQFHCHHRKVRDYRKPGGRVFIGGDAAHIHSPETGLGMNTGIQDAFNLGWKIARVMKGQAPESLLDTYSPERSLVGDEVLKLSDMAHRMTAQFSPLVQKMRSRMMRFFSSYNLRHPTNMENGFQLRICYKPSKFIVNKGKPERFHSLGPSVKAGARMPGGKVFVTDAKAAQENYVSLNDYFDPCKYQLVFLVSPRVGGKELEDVNQLMKLIKPVRDEVQAILVSDRLEDNRFKNFNGLTFADPTLEYHYICGAQCGAVYVVRPDTYVGFAGHPLQYAKPAAYLKKVILALR